MRILFVATLLFSSLSTIVAGGIENFTDVILVLTGPQDNLLNHTTVTWVQENNNVSGSRPLPFLELNTTMRHVSKTNMVHFVSFWIDLALAGAHAAIKMAMLSVASVYLLPIVCWLLLVLLSLLYIRACRNSWEQEFQHRPRRSDSHAPSHGSRPALRNREKDQQDPKDYALDADHLHLTFWSYLKMMFLIGPNAVYLWVSGIIVLKIREFLHKKGIIKPQPGLDA